MSEEENKRPSIVDEETGLPRLLKEKCATCVFRPGNLMHLQEGVLKELIEENNKRGSWITCHETLPYGHYPDFGEAICRGYYDAHGDNSWGVRLAKFAARRQGQDGLPEFDPPPDPREQQSAQP